MLASRQSADIRVFEGLDFSRLRLAFVLSLVVHLAVYSAYRGGRALGLWERLHWKPMGRVIEELQEAGKVTEQPTAPPPVMFVDVSPAAATTEEVPEDTPYYSDRSSRAANPLTEDLSDVPLVDGSQEEIVRTEDVPPPLKAVPLQPALPQSEPEPKPAEPAEPKEPSEPASGDLVLAKASEPEPTTPPRPVEPQERPRTLKEALARLPSEEADALVGRKMRQDGGVRRLSTMSTLDVRASPFGEYDRAIIVAIQNRWFDLLDRRGFGHEMSGKVVLEFRLHYDGRISRMTVAENTVNEMLSLLCQKAILDPSPYARWPSDMRRMIGGDHRDVRFTFYYN